MKIKGVVSIPGMDPEERVFENEFEAIQGMVEGYIEPFYHVIPGTGIAMMMNEEGQFNKPFNFAFSHNGFRVDIYGTVVFLKPKEDEFYGLDPEEIKQVIQWLQENR